MQSNLYALGRKQVFESAHRAVKEERRAGLDVIRHLEVIQDRKLYLEAGYPSLFEFCIKEFGYSNGAAQRRIQAMRLMKSTPLIQQKIEDGEVSITSAAAIQSFLQIECKSGQTYSQVEKLELIDTCAGKSSREVEKELATRNPEFIRRESVRAIDDDHMRVAFNITDELWRKIEKLKSLRSHAAPAMTNEALLVWLVEIGLEKVDPVRKAERAAKKARPAKTDSLPAPEVKARQRPPRRTRYVAATDEHALAPSRKDGCAYIDPLTGRRCGSQHFLQKDHVIPYSTGGSNKATNLQWLCGAHNRLKYSRGSRVESPSMNYCSTGLLGGSTRVDSLLIGSRRPRLRSRLPRYARRIHP